MNLRNSYGLKQSEVARELGISRRQYWRIENVSSDVKIKHIVSLCRLYKVSSDFLLGISEV